MKSTPAAAAAAHDGGAPAAAPPQPWDHTNADEPPAWVEDLTPHLREEMALVVSVYPEAAVYPVREGAQAAEAALLAAESAGLGLTNDSQTSDFVHVARLSLRIDGENLTVNLSAVVPRGYPDHEACRPVFEVRSTNAARVAIASVEDVLEEEVRELYQTGGFSFLTFVGRATELVAGIPLGLQSKDFGFCFTCAVEAAKKARHLVRSGHSAADPAQPATSRKFPQPLRRFTANQRDDGAAASAPEDEHSTVAAARRTMALLARDFTEPVINECLSCHSQSNVVYIETLRPNLDDAQCSFCYFEDNPLIDIPGCGCRACFTCFSSFTNIATGSNELRRCQRTGWVGVPCPNHTQSSVITDPALFKLCETASYLRFNLFAMRMFASEINAKECVDPQCCGLPTASNISGDKSRCAHCRQWSCATCHSFLRDCLCEEWPAPTTRAHYVSSRVELMGRKAASIPGDRVERRIVRLLVLVGGESVPVELDTADMEWMDTLRTQLPAGIDDRPFFLILHGVPLDPKKPLGVYPIYDGAILYVLMFLELLQSKTLETERDLFDFRRHIRTMTDTKRPEHVASAEGGIFKRCPKCEKPVVHYLNHGCHHIGFASSKCCGHHWCYVCRGPYPCKTCPLMCNEHCKCPPCPDCKPMMPCPHCWGCPQCRGANAEAARAREMFT